MDRRSFIRNTGILTAGSILAFTNFKKSGAQYKYKMGYQLFSVNDDMKKDPIATLQKLRKMGYEDFEIYGFDPERVTYYGRKADEFKKELEDLELTVTSGHYGFSPLLNGPDDDLRRFVDQCIKGAIHLESPYITWPWLAPDQRNNETFKILAEKMNMIGMQIKKAGLGFAYHNHGYEFEELDGRTGYEIIMSGTDSDLVKLQLDMYWLEHSSDLTPTELIRKDPGRFVMWHIKDMDKVTRDYTELGNGSIDYVKLLPDPKLSGLEYYYIEQGGNFTHSALQSAATSAAYMKKHLRKFL